MRSQSETNFGRIAAAIEYINMHFKSQPDLDEVAENIALSPYHFQRLFTDWAGVSPKKFLQYITVGHAKKILDETGASLFDTAIEIGLSGTGRLHDLFVKIEGMTPGEYKNGGETLSINFSFAESPFGDLLVASTGKGICHLAFAEEEETALLELKRRFPNATYDRVVDMIQQNALFIFTQDWSKIQDVKLHVKGSPFQLKVWETLLKVPPGKLATYGALREKWKVRRHQEQWDGHWRESGGVPYSLPSHHSVDRNYWRISLGSTRKKAMIGWEAAIYPLREGVELPKM